MTRVSKLPELAMIGTSLMVGLTMVMGINAINSAPSFMLDYYKYLAGNEDEQPRSPVFWKNILNFYTVVTMVAQAVHEPTNLTSFMCRFSLLFRLELSCLVMVVELLVILIMPQTHVSENGAIAAMMIVAYLGGAARAYFENTGYAMFGPCPPIMLSGMLVGSALSGALVSILQIILKAAMADTYSAVLAQSLIYFCTAIGIIFVSGLLLATLLYNPYARRFIAEFRSRRSPWANIYRPHTRIKTVSEHASLHNSLEKSGNAASGTVSTASRHDPDHSSDDDEMEPHERAIIKQHAEGGCLREDVLFDDREYYAREEQEASRAADTHAAEAPTASRGVEPATSHDDLDKGVMARAPDSRVHGDADSGEGLTTAELLQEVRLWPVIKKIWPMMLACFLTFGITYLMYPGILLAVDSADGWYTTLIMAVYNFSDLFGRILSMWKRLWPPRKWILIASICRLCFIPLLILCATHDIPTQVPAYIFTALMGVTNGFVGTLSMVYSPETPSLKTDGERAMAGQATGACLLIGCAVGSLVQLAEVLPFN